MRTDLEARDTTVPGWDNKPTRRPTAYMLTWKFKGVMTLCIAEQHRLATHPGGIPNGVTGTRELFYTCSTCWVADVEY